MYMTTTTKKKIPKKILRSTVITVTDNRHELFERRKDVHRKWQPNKIERNDGEEARKEKKIFYNTKAPLRGE